MILNFDCCGKKFAHLDLLDIARALVKPERDGDEDDAKDENDEEAYGDGHKQPCHHAVRLVDLSKVYQR